MTDHIQATERKTPMVSSSASAPAALQALTSASNTSEISSSVHASATDFALLVTRFTPDAFANGFTTLVGALMGAMLAYLVQRRLQRVQDDKMELVAAHRLMFSLLQQVNTIVLVQRDYVYSELKNPGRFLSIPATRPFDIERNVLELSELAFMLRDSEARKLLYDFYIAQENYIEALNQWNLRSSFHLERLQPALAASKVSNGSEVTNAIMQKALGDQIYFHAINSTDNCILALQRAFEKLEPLKGLIRAYLVRRFNKNDFTDFEFPETWGLIKQPNSAS